MRGGCPNTFEPTAGQQTVVYKDKPVFSAPQSRPKSPISDLLSATENTLVLFIEKLIYIGVKTPEIAE